MAATTNNYNFPYPQDPDPVDVAGDLQALAENIDTKLPEIIADTVGNMVNSNTENGITVSYDDSDNTLDFDVADFILSFAGDVSGSASIINLSNTNISVSVIDNSHNHSSATITDFSEAVADIVGNMVNANTENGISVTYDDSDNTLDFDINDFDIILSGDLSGSATVTNLSSIIISASVADNSHNHVSSNITNFQAAVEAITESFTTIDVPNGTDPIATLHSDTLFITQDNGILVTGTGSKTVNFSTNATPLNTASSIVSRDLSGTFDIGAIDFVSAAGISGSAGRLQWDSGEGTLLFGLRGGNIDIPIGQKEVALCYNGSGSPMTKGQVVYITGAQGQRPQISLSDALTDATSSKTFGIVAESIANGSEGFVVTFGILRGINTSSFSEGSSIWLSTTPGGITSVPPTQPYHPVFLGYVVRSHASSGEIFVKIQNGYEISELHDVLITSASAGDVLIYNAASALWMNENFNERAQDTIASMITGGSHTNITVSYNDATNTLNFAGTASVSTEQIQDDVAPLFVHSSHTNITATYDDLNNRIILVGSAGGGGGGSGGVSTDVALSNSWWLGV